MVGITELLAVTPAPDNPNRGITEKLWLEIFSLLGTRLPIDFVEYHRLFGEGWFVSVSHPTSATVAVYGAPGYSGRRGISSLIHQVPARLSALRLYKEHHRKTFSFPLYYEPGGFLPWAVASNGADLCWVVTGDLVDNWQVAVVRSGKHELFPMNATGFLAHLFAGSITSALLPDALPGKRGVAFRVNPSEFPPRPAA